MTPEDEKSSFPIVERLMREAGISEAQANELVLLIGLNWASLMREAREITKVGHERARSLESGLSIGASLGASVSHPPE